MVFRVLFLFFFLVLMGCERAALVLHQQKISPTYLASTNVGSPDPRTPPNGEMIVAEWWLPAKVRDGDCRLRIHILFQDFTETVVEFPIRSRVGYETYSVLNKDFKKTGGFLAYRGEILTGDGEVYTDWQHQLWVKLIDVNEEEESEEISSAAVEKSRHASVMDTPRCNSAS